jgi:membrane protease YdiL (CAAX protease family)
MQTKINKRLFINLLVASTLTTLMVLPYTLTLLKPMNLTITPVILVAQVFQSIILFGLAIFFGLKLAAKIGFGLPLLETVLSGKKLPSKITTILGLPTILGALAALLIIVVSFLFGGLSLDFLKAQMAVPLWMSFLASFYGGIAEEILLRLFLMSFFVWITWKIKRTERGLPTAVGVWLAIVLSAVIFGLGHLPVTSGITAITAAVVWRAIILNGIGGVIFGWLFWKKGLEAAMISHFSADIVLHVMVPVVASFFI